MQKLTSDQIRDKIQALSPEWRKSLKSTLESKEVQSQVGVGVKNCHEASTQGRWREREPEVIQQAAEEAIRKQGAEDCGFYSLTWSLHKSVYSLLLWNYARFGNSSLISQRADQASADPNFFKFQNLQGMTTTTIGVEGLSQRFRNYLNKCALLGSRVLTNLGYQKIENIKPDSKVLTEYGPAECDGSSLEGIRECLHIKTRTGNNLHLTPNHPFKILTKAGSFEWVLSENLREGDYVLCQRGDRGMIPLSRGIYGISYTEDPEFWYVIGWLWGDGSRSANLHYDNHYQTWCFSNVDKLEALPRIAAVFDKYQWTYTISEDKGPFPYTDERGITQNQPLTYLVANVRIIHDLLPPFKFGGKWRFGGLPDSYYQLGHAQICALLQALFDTDGGNTESRKEGYGRGRRNFASRFRNLSKSVRDLLHLEGIVSTINYQALRTSFGITKNYSVQIIGNRSLTRFYERVNFGISNKRDQFERLYHSASRQPAEPIFGYPLIQEAFADAFPVGSDVGPRGCSVSTKIREYRRGVTPKVSDLMIPRILERSLEKGKRSAFEFLAQYLEQDWYFDQITSIKPGKTGPVYDVMNSRTSSFVISGAVVHNSLNTDQFMRAVENAARAGFSGLKLFMIATGLEEPEDVQEFCDTLEEISRRTRPIAKEISLREGKERNPIRLNASFMLILPMPHTPLQFAPCSASYDLESDTLRPVMDTVRKLGYTSRTSLTRDRVRVSNWTAMIGREATLMLVESGLRCNSLYYGPVHKRLTYYLDQNFARYGYGSTPQEGWNYWFRQKQWSQIFPWDHIQTAMSRNYLWEQWCLFSQFAGAAYCNPPGSMVTLEDGTVKPIEQIEVGDKVITHRGRSRSVTNIHRRFIKDKLLRIKYTNGFKDLLVTKEHNLLAIKSEDFLLRDGRDGRREDIKIEDLSWISSISLKLRDALHTPTLEYNPRNFSRLWKKEEIAFLGWYAAEGNPYPSNRGFSSGVNISLDKAEIDYAAEVKDLAQYFEDPATVWPKLVGDEYQERWDRLRPVLEIYRSAWKIPSVQLKELGFTSGGMIYHFLRRAGIKPPRARKFAKQGEWDHPDARVVSLYNPAIADLCVEHVGMNSHYKKLSPELFSLLLSDYEYAGLFIESYAKGDGCWGDPDDKCPMQMGSASRQLLEQIYWILEHHGIQTRRTFQWNWGGPNNRDKRTPYYRLHIKDKSFGNWWGQQASISTRNGKTWSVAASTLTEISSIEEEDYEGEVFHLTVDEDHSYLIEGVSHENCLKTSVNVNPSCHVCSACDPGEPENVGKIKPGTNKRLMLTRKIEDSTLLIGKEASRRDMTIRKRVRFKMNITDPFFRNAPKSILARYLTRAFMLAADSKGYEHIIKSFLRMDQTSLKWAENIGQGAIPWTCGIVLADHIFNLNWPDSQMTELLPQINDTMSRNGVKIEGFIASDRLPSFDASCFGLYTIHCAELSYMDAKEGIGKLGIEDVYQHKKKIAAGKGAFRSISVEKTRSEAIPVAYAQMADPGCIATILASLELNPIQAMAQATGKRASMYKPFPIFCQGYYRYDRKRQEKDSNKVEEGDIFAALEDQELYCELTDEPIETDLFTGELYRSKTAPNLCLAADLSNLVTLQQLGVNTHTSLKRT